MKQLFGCVFVVGVILIAFASPTGLLAQTATSGAVVGTVQDPNGGVVTRAMVLLRNKATNIQTAQATNSVGQFNFPNVMPGEYEMTVNKDGFRTATVPRLSIEVSKTYTVNVDLVLGTQADIVTVTAEARVDLQTTDAVIGNVVSGSTLSRLPTLERDASELLPLQPATIPYSGKTSSSGGSVAGARGDQNTTTLDGIDVTENLTAGGVAGQEFVPLGVESLEEFRVGVSNSNATFGRSAGGQVSLITKSGTNDFHGSAYWFHQNDELNANDWTSNANHLKRPETKDNRGGIDVGGPLLRDRTFFFSNYEIRRFPTASQVVRFVPTDSLRSGNLTFLDGTGTPVTYDLATSTACGPSGGLPCDPRGLGISPTIQALYKLEPEGNNTSFGGDGRNNTGFVANLSTPLKDDRITFRLDHNFSSKAHFFGRYIYSRDINTNASQIDDRAGRNPMPLGGGRNRGDGAIGNLDYQFSNHFSNTVRFGWIRFRQLVGGVSATDSATELALPGTNTSAGFIALAPSPGRLDVPIDVDTGRARTQSNYERNKQLVDDATWIRGRHTVVFGADVRWMPFRASRNDKVVGSLASLVATMASSSTTVIPATERPPTCAGAVTTNCIRPSDTGRWNSLYASTLGLLDNVSVLLTRDGQLNAQPFGTPLIADVTTRAYNYYAQDTWRFKPSLTLSAGVSYGWQTPPVEKDGKQTFIVDAATNQILSADSYLGARLGAANAGNVYNPTFGFMPIRSSTQKTIWNTDYTNVAPRTAMAWNPSYDHGVLGRIFGDRKSVLRVGWGIFYDRINTVQSVSIPQLAPGFAQTISVRSPKCNGAGATPGASCGVTADAGGSAFRVGVDGTIPVPAVPAVSAPVVPGLFGEFLSLQVDPDFSVGRSYSSDLSFQRELPGNMLMEIGYVSRLGRNLPNGVDFNSSPYMFLDKASGQTFAQAFNLVTQQLGAGTPVSAVPWFENQLPGIGALAGSSGGCGTPGMTSTACLVQQTGGSGGSFTNGGVGSIFTTMSFDRMALGLPAYNNLQVSFVNLVRTHNDISNYNAAVFTLTKRPSKGLQFSVNYTFSKSLDRVGTVQNRAQTYGTSFDKDLQYGPSVFDRTHVFNGIFNYDLPFGRGRTFFNSHALVDRIVGGWYTAGIFQAVSGLPVTVTQVGGSDAFGGGSFATPIAMIPTVNVGSIGTGVHSGVNGSNGVGTNGNAATGGTGLNLFGDPAAVLADFRNTVIGVDKRDGTGHPLRGLGLWNLDMRVGKATSLFRERYKMEVSADLFNIFNHVNFNDPSLDASNLANFGVISSQYTPPNRNSGARWIQLGLRFWF